ncbi:unnamed protein product [Leptosia nina]|uniref:Uncharacterized protein n=1 Tax=Leptosia nina TaxID=320188 RepID=A0AAV1IW66_9NEOP
MIAFGKANTQSCNSNNNDCTCIFGTLKAEDTSLSVAEAFRKYKLTDYVPIPPKDYLEASYKTADVNLGNFIPPLRIIDRSNINYPKAKENALYTLLTIDVDAPPMVYSKKGYINTLIVNLPKSDNFLTNSGDVIVPLNTPVPCLGTGIHRPMQLVYEQEEYIDPDQTDLFKLARTRLISKITAFAKKYHLGNPVAGNFHITELSYCDGNSCSEDSDDEDVHIEIMFPIYLIILTTPAIFAANACFNSNDCTCLSGFLSAVRPNISVPEAFIKHKISPGYLPVPPQDFLEADFATAQVTLGNFIPALRAGDPTYFAYSKAKKTSLYTLILIGNTDEDVPTSLISRRGFVNYLSFNGHSNNLFCGDISVPLTRPVPALGVPLHHGMALLYEQKSRIDTDQISLLLLARTRVITDIGKFSRTYGLGNPVAGNFIQTELSYCGLP